MRAGGLPARRWTPAPWPVVLALWLMALPALRRSVQHPLDIVRDPAVYLQTARMLLDGGIPYIDIVELNPPLIWYLSLVPTGLAELTGLPSPLGFQLCMVALAALSATLTWRVGQQLWSNPWAAAIAALVPLGSLYRVSPLHFGQREHLFVLCLLPFLVLRSARWLGREQPHLRSAGIGILAALGLLLKAPYFLPAWLLAEPLWFWLARDRRARLRAALLAPELAAALAVGLAYLVHFWLLPSPAAQNFFGRYLPLLTQGYGVYNQSWERLLAGAGAWMLRPALPLLLASPLLLPRWRRRQGGMLVAGYFSLGLVGALTYFLQHKAWGYHTVPTQLSGLCAEGLLAGLGGGWLLRRRSMPRVRWPSALVHLLGLAAVGVLLSGRDPSPPLPRELREEGPVSSIERWSRPGDPVLLLNTLVNPAYPMLVQLDRRSGSRYLWGFPLALLLAHADRDEDRATGFALDPAREQEAERYVDDLKQDVRTRRPVLVLLNDAATCPACPRGLNIPRWLRARGFDEALGAYEELDGDSGYRVYRRRAE